MLACVIELAMLWTKTLPPPSQ